MGTQSHTCAQKHAKCKSLVADPKSCLLYLAELSEGKGETFGLASKDAKFSQVVVAWACNPSTPEAHGRQRQVDI